VLKGNSDYHKLNQVVSSFEADEPDVRMTQGYIIWSEMPMTSCKVDWEYMSCDIAIHEMIIAYQI